MSLGRPKNQYRKSTAEFSAYWGREPKFATVQQALAEDIGFSAVGYALDSLKNHMFRVTLTPTDSTNAFFWVRFETADREIDFSIPAVIRAADIDTLLNWWGFLDVDRNVQWVMGPIASAFFPDDWKMVRPYVVSPLHFDVIVFDLEQRRHTLLMERAGLHTIKTSNQLRRIAGVVGESNVFKLVEGLRGLPPDVKLPRTPVGALSLPVLAACWQMSANYFAEKLLVANVKPHPFIPHSHLIDIPLDAVPRELVP